MFFNFNRIQVKASCALLFLSLSFASLIACSNEEKENSQLNISLSFDSSCLDGMSVRLADWTEGKGSRKAIRNDVDCTTEGIEYFLKRVRGMDTNSYSRIEVYNIIQKFFKFGSLDQDVVDDILEIKSWIIGGSKYLITKNELKHLSVFLQNLKPVLANLTPVADKLFFGMTKKNLREDFSLSEATFIRSSLGSFLEQLADLSILPVNPIKLKRLYAVQYDLAKKLNYEPFKKETITTYWHIFNTLLGQERKSDIAFKPRSKVYTYLEKVYFLGLRLKYGVLDSNWDKPLVFTHLEAAIEETLPFLKEVINNQKDNTLSKKQIQDLVALSLKQAFGDQALETQYQELIVERLFSKFFRLQGDDLRASDINILRQEWDEFRNFQNNTVTLYGQRFNGSFVKQNALTNLSPSNLAAIDFAWPMVSNNRGYVLTDLEPRYVEANFSNLFRLNWQRALSRILISMYTEEPQRRTQLTGLNINEVEKAYSDVFKILHSLDILGADEQDSWFRIFNEGNLFVPRAKSDTYFSYVEGVDFFALLFSAFEISSDLKKDLDTHCQDDKKCEVQWLQQSDPTYWQDSIPKFGYYLLDMNSNSSEWMDWLNAMEEVARGGQTSPEAFSKSDLLAFLVASQYIEVFLRKYDKNYDQEINFEESFESFSKFKSALLMLPQIQGTQAENDLQTLFAVYTFFLRKGRMPKEIFGQPIELLGWLGKIKICTKLDDQNNLHLSQRVSTCSFSSKRSKLMKILAVLTNAI